MLIEQHIKEQSECLTINFFGEQLNFDIIKLKTKPLHTITIESSLKKLLNEDKWSEHLINSELDQPTFSGSVGDFKAHVKKLVDELTCQELAYYQVTSKGEQNKKSSFIYFDAQVDLSEPYGEENYKTIQQKLYVPSSLIFPQQNNQFLVPCWIVDKNLKKFVENSSRNNYRNKKRWCVAPVCYPYIDCLKTQIFKQVNFEKLELDSEQAELLRPELESKKQRLVEENQHKHDLENKKRIELLRKEELKKSQREAKKLAEAEVMGPVDIEYVSWEGPARKLVKKIIKASGVYLRYTKSRKQIYIGTVNEFGFRVKANNVKII